MLPVLIPMSEEQLLPWEYSFKHIQISGVERHLYFVESDKEYLPTS